jgi:hypothetical protein
VVMGDLKDKICFRDEHEHEHHLLSFFSQNGPSSLQSILKGDGRKEQFHLLIFFPFFFPLYEPHVWVHKGFILYFIFCFCVSFNWTCVMGIMFMCVLQRPLTTLFPIYMVELGFSALFSLFTCHAKIGSSPV